jgi:succinate dehydrogenase / fumarate reductase iron-sulfur subunit
MNELIKRIKMFRNKHPAGDENADNEKNIREKINLKVFRTNGKSESHFDTFEIPIKRWTTVLDALLHAKSYCDSSIGIRYSCRMASCGSCGMKINGIPRLACYTKISELKGGIVSCEPLANFPQIRDLVTDFSVFFNHHKQMQPFIQNENIQTDEREVLTEYIQKPEDLDKYLQFSYCIKCGLCYSACPTVATDTKFPGPQALSQAYRYSVDNRDNALGKRQDIIDDRHGIWRCHFAGSCSAVCPKGVDPALGIQLLRGHILRFSKNEQKLAELQDRPLDKS